MADKPTMTEDEIRQAYLRFDQMSTDEKKRLAKAVKALPKAQEDKLRTDLGLVEGSGGWDPRIGRHGPQLFGELGEILAPKGLDKDKQTAQDPKKKGSLEAQQAGERVVTAVRPSVATQPLPPKWLMEVLGGPTAPGGKGADEQTIVRIASAYAQLTGREMPTDAEGAKAALFRDPAFQGKSTAAAVAAQMVLGIGVGSSQAGAKSEFRYRNAAGQERKVELDGTALSAATDAQPGFLPHIRSVAIAGEEAGIPWQVLYGVIRAMSGWDPGKVSRLGGEGPEGTTAASESNRLSESDTAGQEAQGGWAADLRGQPGRQKDASNFSAGGIRFVTETLDAYFEELGDWGLAIMAMQDPEAARTLKATGRTTNKGAWDFARKALFGPNGDPGSEGSIMKFGWDGDGFNMDAFDAVGKQVGAGKNARVVQLPDRESMGAQIRNVFKGLLLRDANDQEIGSFIELIESQIIAAAQAEETAATNAAINPYAPQGAVGSAAGITTVRKEPDPGAQLESQIRGTAEYKDLYKNKPGYMDESQYVGQIAGQASQITGRAPDEQTLRTGLQIGAGDGLNSYINGQEAGKNTVSFRERLYGLSKILNGL